MHQIQLPLSQMAREVAAGDPRIAALLHRDQLESAGGHRSRRASIGAWRIYLAIGAVALFVYYFLPNEAVQRVYFTMFATSSVMAICLGVRMHRPTRARSWLLLAAGLGTINLGNILWAWFEFTTGNIPYPSIADALFLGGYLTVAVSLLTLFRGRVPGGDWNGLIDATIVTVGLGMLSWVFFMAPVLRDVELHPVDTLVAVAYPLVDVLLFGIAARLFFTAGPRPMAFRFLALALGANILADVANTLVSLTGTYQASLIVDSGWALGFLAYGAFALHPTMRDVERLAGVRKEGFGWIHAQDRRRLGEVHDRLRQRPGSAADIEPFRARLDGHPGYEFPSYQPAPPPDVALIGVATRPNIVCAGRVGLHARGMLAPTA